MRLRSLLLPLILLAPAVYAADSPLVGRWDFTFTTGGATRAAWVGVNQKGSDLEPVHHSRLSNLPNPFGGVYSGEATPDPIPNSEVKPACGDSSTEEARR